MYLSELIDNDIHVYRNINKKHPISGISSDSRQIKKGMIFAVIDGIQTKGKKFINHAYNSGASAILCNKKDIKDIKVKIDNILVTKNVRLAVSKIAKKFYPNQPNFITAVTGTNGKTSIVSFLRKIWYLNDIKGASIGTLGIEYNTYKKKTKLTTLDPINLHKELSLLKNKKINYLAMESSSHALAQHRLDKVKIKYAVFTNLSRDHLDYHKSMQSYFLCKGRLFKYILDKKGKAVINVDTKYGIKIKEICVKRNIKIITYGFSNKADWQIIKIKNFNEKNWIKLKKNKKTYNFECNFFSDFEVENLVCAIILANINGLSLRKIFKSLIKIKEPTGRMQKVLIPNNKNKIFVDFAHTPEALKNALMGLKKQISKGSLLLVFGCGGNRDKGKRKVMANVAEKFADKVFITDDNPRFENAGSIRAEISKNCKNSINIGNRKKAIFKAIKLMKEEDILLIAGKGHEKVQEIRGKAIPFDDFKVVKEAIAKVSLI